jgi:hypothetical protein
MTPEPSEPAPAQIKLESLKFTTQQIEIMKRAFLPTVKVDDQIIIDLMKSFQNPIFSVLQYHIAVCPPEV